MLGAIKPLWILSLWLSFSQSMDDGGRDGYGSRLPDTLHYEDASLAFS